VTGVVARYALEHVGDGGRVVGTDINAGMLAVARTAVPGVAASDWREASADDLPFPDEEFDVALCQLGLQFFGDKPAAARELRRVLVSGGRLFVNVPGPTPRLFAELEEALARRLGPDVAGFVHAVFSFHDAAELRELFSNAGWASSKSRRGQRSCRSTSPLRRTFSGSTCTARLWEPRSLSWTKKEALLCSARSSRRGSRSPRTAR
jgi:ubiquinone/menaquinone biosynthesis C-methylase UbiE